MCSTGPSSTTRSARLPTSSEPSSLVQPEHPGRVQRGRRQRLAHAPAVAAHGEPDHHRHRRDRRRARVAVAWPARRSPPRRPARARAAMRSAPRNSAPGSSTAAHSAAASGATSSGCRQARWSTERAPAASATGTERWRGELLDVRAQRHALAARRSRPAARDPRCGTRRTRRRCRARRPPPARPASSTSSIQVSGVVARRHRVREQAGDAVEPERAAEPHRAQPRPRSESP